MPDEKTTPQLDPDLSPAEVAAIKERLAELWREFPEVEQMYGHFHGGDPRMFSPDEEACSPAEMERHRLACERWDAGETPEHERVPGEPVLLKADGTPLVHCTRDEAFGIGVQTWANPVGEFLARDVPALLDQLAAQRERAEHLQMVLEEAKKLTPDSFWTAVDEFVQARAARSGE